VNISTASTKDVTALQTNIAAPNVVGPVNFRFVWTADNNRQYANIDNVWLKSYVPPETGQAECALDAPVTAAFNGSAQTNTFTISPAGIPYSVAYAPPIRWKSAPTRPR
jgi:hypothetical protein